MAIAMYPVGTRVRIRCDLIAGELYGDPKKDECTIELEEGMAELCGQVKTITDADGARYGIYKLDDDGYFWNRRMFNVLPPERTEAKATWMK